VERLHKFLQRNALCN